jgi:hypothetical protein
VHVGSEDDGCACGDGFGGVLAATGAEAFSDEDGGGEEIPTGELAGGVHEKDVRALRSIRPASAGDGETEGGEFACYGVASFLVARDEDEEEVREFPAE